MPHIVNIGSINIDYVYKVEHFLRAGETLQAARRNVFMGGKGLNQSVAVARSGLSVRHVGVLGGDGQFLYDFLKDSGVDITYLRLDPEKACGHTVIQVTPDGENAILYFPGTNHSVDAALVESALSDCDSEDIVLLQNEVNDVGRNIGQARAKGLKVVFNPAPFSARVLEYPLDAVDVIVLNETEAMGMLQTEQASSDHQSIVGMLHERFPQALIILTTGSRGLNYVTPGGEFGALAAYPMKAVDTTGAGDTFVGYAMRAIAHYLKHADKAAFEKLLHEAVAAAGLSVTREGAVNSIPPREEVARFLAEISQRKF